jgi:hypothetical protein
LLPTASTPPALRSTGRGTEWWPATAFGLFLILVLLFAAWFLRLFAPIPVATKFAIAETPTAFPIPQQHDSVPDPREVLAQLAVEHERLGDQLAFLEAELRINAEKCRSSSAPKAATPPALPEVLWSGKNLAVLRGCWELGRDAPAVRGGLAAPNRETNCVMKAGRICLDDRGQGHIEQLMVCPRAGAVRCKAPITANFEIGGSMTLRKAEASCNEGASTIWLARTYACRRLNDEIALCRGHAGVPGFPDVDYEFRKAR